MGRSPTGGGSVSPLARSNSFTRKQCVLTLADPKHFSTNAGTTSALVLPNPRPKSPPVSPSLHSPPTNLSSLFVSAYLAVPFPPYSTNAHAASTPFSWLTALGSRTQSRTAAGLLT